MRRADWIGRFLCAVVTFGIAQAQLVLYTPSNDLPGVAFNQVLSALTNAFALLSAAALMRGRASFDMQRLAFCAIVVNFLSFLAYAAKISPLISALNGAITVISYVQLVILLWPRDGNPDITNRRLGIFRFAYLQGKSLHMEAEK